MFCICPLQPSTRSNVLMANALQQDWRNLVHSWNFHVSCVIILIFTSSSTTTCSFYIRTFLFNSIPSTFIATIFLFTSFSIPSSISFFKSHATNLFLIRRIYIRKIYIHRLSVSRLCVLFYIYPFLTVE